MDTLPYHGKQCDHSHQQNQCYLHVHPFLSSIKYVSRAAAKGHVYVKLVGDIP